jgi:hypothetical protein
MIRRCTCCVTAPLYPGCSNVSRRTSDLYGRRCRDLARRIGTHLIDHAPRNQADGQSCHRLTAPNVAAVIQADERRLVCFNLRPARMTAKRSSMSRPNRSYVTSCFWCSTSGRMSSGSSASRGNGVRSIERGMIKMPRASAPAISSLTKSRSPDAWRKANSYREPMTASKTSVWASALSNSLSKRWPATRSSTSMNTLAGPNVAASRSRIRAA